MRLLASGCSFTDYYWSTWADILGKEFVEYDQVGQGGADNATIARSVISNARAGDLVVIMWSSYDRWSFYSDEVIPTPKDENNHWRHLGSLAKWDKLFFVKYYNQIERFQTTMDYIQLIDLHSKVNNYTVYNFSAFPFFLAETESVHKPELTDIFNKYTLSNNYLTDISLDEFRVTNYNILINGDDPHPTPLCNWDYVEQIIAPKLGIKLTIDNKSDIIKEQAELIKRTNKWSWK